MSSYVDIMSLPADVRDRFNLLPPWRQREIKVNSMKSGLCVIGVGAVVNIGIFACGWLGYIPIDPATTASMAILLASIAIAYCVARSSFMRGLAPMMAGEGAEEHLLLAEPVLLLPLEPVVPG